MEPPWEHETKPKVYENSDQKTQKVVSDVIKTVILMKDSDFDERQ